MAANPGTPAGNCTVRGSRERAVAGGGGRSKQAIFKRVGGQCQHGRTLLGLNQSVKKQR